MALVKNFCRLVTHQEIDDDTVIDFFDIVQSIVPTKLVTGFSSSGEVVSVEVIAYTDDTDQYVYEIILNEEISASEGDSIADELANEFDFDFDFEASIEA
jgi:hypothetical protein